MYTEVIFITPISLQWKGACIGLSMIVFYGARLFFFVFVFFLQSVHVICKIGAGILKRSSRIFFKRGGGGGGGGRSRNFRTGVQSGLQGSKLIADSAMLDTHCRDREAGRRVRND